MHTIVAFSDSHHAHLPQKLLDIASEADSIFFLGDGSMSLDSVLFHKDLHIVDGNCDPPCFGNEKIVEYENVKIMLTHGHIYSVKRDLLPLALHAKELGCQAVFYGHTHFAGIEEYDKVTLICPGSPSFPNGNHASYAYAVAHDGKLTVKIVNLS